MRYSVLQHDKWLMALYAIELLKQVKFDNVTALTVFTYGYTNIDIDWTDQLQVQQLTKTFRRDLVQEVKMACAECIDELYGSFDEAIPKLRPSIGLPQDVYQQFMNFKKNDPVVSRKMTLESLDLTIRGLYAIGFDGTAHEYVLQPEFIREKLIDYQGFQPGDEITELTLRDHAIILSILYRLFPVHNQVQRLDKMFIESQKSNKLEVKRTWLSTIPCRTPEAVLGIKEYFRYPTASQVAPNDINSDVDNYLTLLQQYVPNPEY